MLWGIPYSKHTDLLSKSLKLKFGVEFDWCEYIYDNYKLVYTMDSETINQRADDFVQRLLDNEFDSQLTAYLIDFLQETIQEFVDADEIETLVGCSNEEALEILERLKKI